MNTDLFNLLTQPEEFETACELIETIDSIKKTLFSNFRLELIKKLSEHFNESKWKVISEDYQNNFEAFISILSKNQKTHSIGYSIYFSPKAIDYGIWIDRDIFTTKELNNIYLLAKEFKAKYGWKTGNEKDFNWPIYYSIKDFSLSTPKDFKKLLPSKIESSIIYIINEFLNGFDENSQTFIKTFERQIK